ncbi:MAG: DUF3466 family protein [Betaproteobacteria bacterium]|nr:DUF3466 family protein [Betaproteobacteria bacterium]
MKDLGTLGGQNSYGYGINASGQVTGESSTRSGGEARAFLYSDGTMQDLGTLGGASSSARGINGSGEIVGWATAGWGGRPRAFVYSGGMMYDLNSLVVSGLNGATLAEATESTTAARSWPTHANTPRWVALRFGSTPFPGHRSSYRCRSLSFTTYR